MGATEAAGAAVVVRPGRMDDLAALVAIYNHYVVTSHVTFDVEPTTQERRTPWFRQFSADGRHRILVAEHRGVIAGYACSAPLKDKPAYAPSVETSVYVAPDRHRLGIGRLLLGRLLQALSDAPVHRAYAQIALPNDASERLHTAFGFHRIGVLSEVGFKFGRYWDVAWWEAGFDANQLRADSRADLPR